MNAIKFFDNFEGVWKDAIGSGGDIISFTDGSGWTSTPKKGFFNSDDIQGFIGASQIGTGLVDNTEFNYLNGVTSSIQTQIDSKVAKTNWIDYSATSTIVGWSSYTTKKLQYKLIDSNLMVVQFNIEGTGSGTSTTFTLPYSASTWARQYFVYHSLNNNTTQASSICYVDASSSSMVFSMTASTGGTNSWANATTRHIHGIILINI